MSVFSSGEEELMRPPAKNPCNDCPWRRNSIRGWLGPTSAEDWVRLAHTDAQIACHQTIPEGSDDNDPVFEDMTTCAGATIFRANVCKSPRTTRGLPEYQLPADRERVFSWNDEFLAHHTRNNRPCDCGCHAFDGAPFRQPCKACGHDGTPT